MLPKRYIFTINIYSIIYITLTIIYISIGVLAIILMPSFFILIATVCLAFINLIVLKKYWLSQYYILKKTILITCLIILIAYILYLFLNAQIFLLLMKYILIGLLSINFFMPLVFDQFLRLISFSNNLSSFSEALILYRNILNGTINEFIFGMKTILFYGNKGLLNKVKKLVLITVSIIGFIPILNNELLISSHLKRFSIQNIKLLFKKDNIYIINMLIFIALFLILVLL